MEKGIDAYIREQFQIEAADIRSCSPLTLAYMGDGVFELVIRSVVVGHGNARPNELHRRTSHIVKAQTQALLIEEILPLLTEEEENVYRRGRNANPATTAKNASVADYRHATGFEALIGFLYLRNDLPRIVELTKHGLEKLGFLRG